MRELDRYGPTIKVYEGVGVAISESGEQVNVYFDARQRQDSSIIVGCMAQSGVMIPRNVREIRGTTTEHDAIRISGERTNLHTSMGGAVPFMIYAFTQMHLSQPIFNNWPIEVVTCAIANFIFEYQELSTMPDPIEVTFRGYQIRIEPVGNYPDVYGLLRAVGGIQQTATAIITPGDNERIDEDALSDLLFALSHPLTLARSTRVMWLWYRAETISNSDHILPHHTYHVSSFPLSFTIKAMASGFTADVATLVKAWGNEQMQRLLPLNDVYPRIAQYLDAVRESAFAESAGLAAATLLDVLANGHAVATGRTAVIPENVWKEYIAPDLRDALMSILIRLPQTAGEPESSRATATRADAIKAVSALDRNQRAALGQRLDNEWRTTFRKNLTSLMKALKIECDFTDDVLATRNRLVHEARFATADTGLELSQLFWLTYALLLRLVDPEIDQPFQWFGEKRRYARLLRSVRDLQGSRSGAPVAKAAIAARLRVSDGDVHVALIDARHRGDLDWIGQDQEHVRLTEQGWSKLTPQSSDEP